MVGKLGGAFRNREVGDGLGALLLLWVFVWANHSSSWAIHEHPFERFNASSSQMPSELKWECFLTLRTFPYASICFAPFQFFIQSHISECWFGSGLVLLMASSSTGDTSARVLGGLVGQVNVWRLALRSTA